MLHDGLQNIVANIGTDKDKASSHQWFVRQRSNVELEAIYRSGWMGRKIIDIPTSDMTRKWRQWTGEQSFIDKVSDVEKKFGIRQKITKAKRWARLYGSSAIIIGASPKLGKPDEPLDVSRMSVNDLKYLHVEIAPYLTIREWNTDITSERFGEPEFYYYQPLRHAGTMDPGSVSTLAHVRVHASRVIPFSGMPLPVFASFQGSYWGDSIFTSLEDTLNTAGSATSVIASLLMEAKTDVIKTDLSGIGTKEGEERIQRRFSLAMMLKSINNTVLMGNDEEWQQKTLNFAGLPDIHIRLMQEISGAARIPLTRFLGQTPTGLNNSGEGDLRNYYDDISQSQEDELRPQLERLDALLFASNGIQLPKDAGFTFTPLWQESEDQKATTQLKKAQATKIYLESGLIDTEVLGRAVESQLVEDGVYPGLEAALKDEAGMDKEPEDVVEETSSSVKDNYDPSQPRAPAGSENGGQWVSAPFQKWGAEQNRKNAADFASLVEGLGKQFEAKIDNDEGGSSYVVVLLHSLTKKGERAKNKGPVHTRFKARFSNHAQYFGASISVDPVSGNTVQKAFEVFKHHVRLAHDVPKIGVSRIDPGGLGQRSGVGVYNRAYSGSSGEEWGPWVKMDSSVKDYDPSQPRAPAGSENGGQWVSGGGMSAAEAQKNYDARTIPDGWYVHGRAVAANGSDPLDTGWVVQLSKDIDAADHYAGESGSVWFIKPQNGANVLDLSGGDRASWGTLAKAFLKSFHDGSLPSDMPNLSARKAWESVKGEFSPKNIVSSAQAYDNPKWVAWLYEKTGAEFVHTPDGAVAIDHTRLARGNPVRRGLDAKPPPFIALSVHAVLAKRKSDE